MQYRKFTYDSGVWDTYFYEKNLFGDIVSVYDEQGTKLITYEYDPWGKIYTTWTFNNAHLTGAVKNPFCYRGYYYDSETGFYYLNSRYYDPVLGRFISPDSEAVITATPGALTDKNLYAYCDNNPITRADDGGEFWFNVVIGAAIGFVGGLIDQAISGNWSVEGWIQTGISTIECAVSTVAGPVTGAVISGVLGGVCSAIEGNDNGQILLDAAISAGISLVGSGAQLVAGRALAGEFIENASKHEMKILANQLGYVGRNFKSAGSWTGRIMLDASLKFMDEAPARIFGKSVEFIVTRNLNAVAP